jgi:hypothetical protein
MTAEVVGGVGRSKHGRRWAGKRILNDAGEGVRLRGDDDDETVIRCTMYCTGLCTKVAKEKVLSRSHQKPGFDRNS